ncbi:PaaI family thioesterase [Enterococcus sp. DIV0876]|uniref:PaaI family thioesterase n=1 Tax=Enterococcus sp. DIV0876 TaxID=2774633 RepID=UPI003D2FA339
MNLLEALGIQIEEATAAQVRLRMNIGPQHKQPFGIVHGGINGVLIETACSIGANQALAADEAFAAGIDLQVNHLHAVQDGVLIVEAIPDKIGHRIQTWQATIWQENGPKTAVGRCTLTTLKQKKQAANQ